MNELTNLSCLCIIKRKLFSFIHLSHTLLTLKSVPGMVQNIGEKNVSPPIPRLKGDTSWWKILILGFLWARSCSLLNSWNLVYIIIIYSLQPLCKLHYYYYLFFFCKWGNRRTQNNLPSHLGSLAPQPMLSTIITIPLHFAQ